MAFTPHQLLAALPARDTACLVAFSGGLDSHVLLHALCGLRDDGRFTGPIRALHVNHGLSANADHWAQHCRVVCTALGVPLEVRRVNVVRTGEGLENAARKARLAVFGEILSAREALLTAHHLDDQVETLLFRMLRGTGLRGLAGIRRQRPLGRGMVLRPLLDVSRDELSAYAHDAALTWIEDESNLDTTLDRNYLRSEVMPLLAARWPGFRKNWQRLAQLAEDGEQLQRLLGDQDLQGVRDGIHRLAIPALKEFEPVRQRNILRCWFLGLEDSHGLPAPDYYVVDRICNELIPAREDATPVVAWQKSGHQAEVRRYGDHVYLVLDNPAAADVLPCAWQAERPLVLPAGLGTLSLVENDSAGFVLPDDGRLEVVFRAGGESARPAGRKSRPLKKILQDYHVPPWLRGSIPLICRDGELVAVADLFICSPWQVEQGAAGKKKVFRIHWDKPDLHCGY